MVHSYYLQNYLPKSTFLAYLIYGKRTSFIAVSKEIQKKVEQQYRFANCFQIYNPVDLKNLKNNLKD